MTPSLMLGRPMSLKKDIRGTTSLRAENINYQYHPLTEWENPSEDQSNESFSGGMLVD